MRLPQRAAMLREVERLRAAESGGACRFDDVVVRAWALVVDVV